MRPARCSRSDTVVTSPDVAHEEVALVNMRTTMDGTASAEPLHSPPPALAPAQTGVPQGARAAAPACVMVTHSSGGGGNGNGTHASTSSTGEPSKGGAPFRNPVWDGGAQVFRGGLSALDGCSEADVVNHDAAAVGPKLAPPVRKETAFADGFTPAECATTAIDDGEYMDVLPAGTTSSRTHASGLQQPTDSPSRRRLPRLPMMPPTKDSLQPGVTPAERPTTAIDDGEYMDVLPAGTTSSRTHASGLQQPTASSPRRRLPRLPIMPPTKDLLRPESEAGTAYRHAHDDRPEQPAGGRSQSTTFPKIANMEGIVATSSCVAGEKGPAESEKKCTPALAKPAVSLPAKLEVLEAVTAAREISQRQHEAVFQNSGVVLSWSSWWNGIVSAVAGCPPATPAPALFSAPGPAVAEQTLAHETELGAVKEPGGGLPQIPMVEPVFERIRPPQSSTLLQRILGNHIAPAVQRRRHVILIGTALLFLAALWVATTIPIGLHPPTFAPEKSNIARAQLLRAKFPESSDGARPVLGPPIPAQPPGPTPPPSRARPTPPPARSPTVPGSVATMAPRTVDEYPNIEVNVVFGIRENYVDRIGSAKSRLADDTSLWRPVFDDKLGTMIYTGTAADWARLCSDITNSSLVIPGQYAGCMATATALATRVLPGDLPLPTTCIGQAQWISTSFVSSEPKDGSPFAIYNAWLEWDRLINGVVGRYPFVTSAFPITSQWSSTVYIVLAIQGAIWAIVFSYLTSCAAVILFTSEHRVALITMACILVNLVLVIAGFVLLGWEIGAVEAISFSILVGVSIDYFIHFIEGYRHADATNGVDPASSPADQRLARVQHAMTTVAVPIVSSAFTTGGAAALLCGTKIQPLKRFGEILVLNVFISLLLTLGVTSSLLLLGGPIDTQVSWRRFAGSMLVVGILIGLVLGIMSTVTVQDSLD